VVASPFSVIGDRPGRAPCVGRFVGVVGEESDGRRQRRNLAGDVSMERAEHTHGRSPSAHRANTSRPRGE